MWTNAARGNPMPSMRPARPRTARILSVGDELVFGRVVDTNAAFLCRLLTDRGFQVRGVRQAGDDQAGLVAAIRESADADLLLISGGLGPTDDDRTRHALAEAMGVALREHAPSWRAIRLRYAQVASGRELPANNRRQALLPVGARPLANDRGTAPGITASLGKTRIAVLPGVPHEMRAMAERFAASLPRLFRDLRAPAIGELWFSGLGESAAQQRLGGLLTAAEPQVGITVSELGYITLRVVGTKTQVDTRLAEMRPCLEGHLLPACGLAASLVQELALRGATLTAAESCTGGHVAAQLTAIPNASVILRSSQVAYHPAAKIALGVSPGIARKQTVSESCARQLAAGVRAQADASFGIATTGFAGPTGGTAADPIGTVYLAVATARGTVARRVFIQGVRERIQARAAAAALQLCWEVVSGRVRVD